MSSGPRYFTVFLLIIITLSACGDELKNEMDAILETDPRNKSVNFSLQNSGKNLDFCVHNLSDEASTMDVFRVFLHAADYLKNRQFEKVNLCFRNETRFVLDGANFLVIGQEFETQNPMYTVRTLPEKLSLPDGQAAYETHSGGLFYLMRVQMEDFSDMNNEWYMNELAEEQKAKTDAQRPTEFAPDEEVF